MTKSTGVLPISAPVAVGTDVAVETECYLVKRRFLMPEGDVHRYVKVCEVVEADQP